MESGHFGIGDRRRDGPARPLGLWIPAALVCAALVAGTASGQESPPPPTALPQLSPPPLVRIVGVTTKRGARISRLTARVPVGTAIVSRCIAKRKKRCPYSQKVMLIKGAVGTRSIHIKGFERSFRAGVVLELYVVKTGHTGKFTSFTIRLHRTPRRRDRCVSGLTLTPVICPLS